ncbi:MAG: UDP-N-acetylmuramate--L-alanine ligase [Lachnospiraceae bacterium]|nr:UDP-N-acetylmuramate--L-alanine ligase [Lachnospiraceae bacterium]
MVSIDFSHPVSVHFIGIGGISMSGLARILKNAGFRVTGSDREEGEQVEELRALGFEVAVPQLADNITRFSPIDLVVYTAAIHPDNEEYAEAVRCGIPMLTRAELLGQIMAQYARSVAVAGTHGKTTTTAMLSQILTEAGADPTLSVGAVFPAIGGNVRIGSSDVFVAEACEYTNSFLSLSPRIGVILNIEADHLDFFKDLDDIRSSFRRFAARVPENGTVILGDTIPDPREITDDLPCRNVITTGFAPDSDLLAEDIVHDRMETKFRAVSKDGSSLEITLQVPGDHNVRNALAAIAAARLLAVDDAVIARALSSFTGASRRFQKLGVKGGVTIVDDYAHHPSEIRATLTAARSLGFSRVWCAFQSHTYTRTKALMDDFADALTLADEVVLADIYAARETDTLGISSRDLQEKIRNLGHPCYYFPSFSEIQSFLEKKCCENDLLIFMGAGTIDRIGYSMLSDS